MLRKNEKKEHILGWYSEEWCIAQSEVNYSNIHYRLSAVSFLGSDFEREINCTALQKYKW